MLKDNITKLAGGEPAPDARQMARIVMARQILTAQRPTASSSDLFPAVTPRR